MYHIHAEKDTVNKQHQKFRTLSVKFLIFAELKTLNYTQPCEGIVAVSLK